MDSKQYGSRLPTMAEAVEIVGQQITLAGKLAQLRFMRETQGDDFAQQVKVKAAAAGKLKGAK